MRVEAAVVGRRTEARRGSCNISLSSTTCPRLVERGGGGAREGFFLLSCIFGAWDAKMGKRYSGSRAVAASKW